MREDDQRDMGQPQAECKFRVASQAKPFLIGENYMRVNNSFCGCVVWWGHKVENYSNWPQRVREKPKHVLINIQTY